MTITVTFPKKRIIVEPSGGGGIPAEGDMIKAVYDPTGVEDDAFDMANMAENADAKILTAAERNNIETAYEHSQTAHAVGDMTKAVYDPNNKNADAFNLDNIEDGVDFVKVKPDNVSYWDSKAEPDHTHAGVYEPADDNIQAHVTSAHAPADAQKNSDITKEEIETKLTGEISSHSHAAAERGFTLNVHCTAYSPYDSQNVYFGNLLRPPFSTDNGYSKIFIRKACTLKIADINSFAQTEPGTNENWSLYIRINGIASTLIATVSSNSAVRNFSNSLLNLSLAVGDYIEIKSSQPAWATNPNNVYFSGYLYFQLP